MNLDTRRGKAPGAMGSLEAASAELKKQDAAKDAAEVVIQQAYEDAPTMPDGAEDVPVVVESTVESSAPKLQEVAGWAEKGPDAGVDLDAETVITQREAVDTGGPEVAEDADTEPTVTEAAQPAFGGGGDFAADMGNLPENSLNEDFEAGETTTESEQAPEVNYESVGREMREQAMKEAQEVMDQVAGEIDHAVENAGPALLSLMDTMIGKGAAKVGEAVAWRDQAKQDLVGEAKSSIAAAKISFGDRLLKGALAFTGALMEKIDSIAEDDKNESDRLKNLANFARTRNA
jgi:hypothetical protein